MAKHTAAQKLKGPTRLERFASKESKRYESEFEKRPNANFRFENITLVDQSERHIRWDVLDFCTSAQMEWTIVGSSILRIELEDPHQTCLENPIFRKWMFRLVNTSVSSAKTYKARKVSDSKKTARQGEENEEVWVLPSRHIDLNCDGIWFRLTGFQIQETKLTLIFEDRLAAILREQRGYTATINRGTMTRAGFINHLCNIAEHSRVNKGKVKRFIPELHIPQPVAENVSEGQSSTDLRRSSSKELTVHDGITIEGKPATTAQLNTLTELLEIAVELKAGGRAQIALVLTAMMESNVNPNQAGNPRYGGVLAGDVVNVFHHYQHEVPQMTKAFLKGDSSKGFQAGGAISYAKLHPNATPVEIGEAVQGIAGTGQWEGEHKFSGAPDEAKKVVTAFGSFENEEGEIVQTVPGPYPFSRGPNETSWDCIQRLASEVSWYAFVRNNALWYVSGNYLLAQAPRMTIVKGDRGVEWINAHVEIGARDKAAEVEVIGRAKPFTAEPGETVHISRMGPLGGSGGAAAHWVVENIAQDLMDRSDHITVKLVKTLPARKEPAPPTTQEQVQPGENPAGEDGMRDPSGKHALPLEAQYMVPLGRTDDGVDIENCPDGKPVFSMTPGECTAVASDAGGFGPNYPVIKVTGGGQKEGKYIYYGHVAKCLIKKGDKVYAGQQIAVMGHTGDAASLGKGHIEIGFCDSGGNPTSHHGASASTPSGVEMRNYLIWLCAMFGLKAK